MNPKYDNGSFGSLSSFNIDIGIGSSRTKSLNDQRTQTSTASSFSSYSAQPKPSLQPNKPSRSWIHQPAPVNSTASGLNGPTSMVGDIFGKSWASSASSMNSDVGIMNKDPQLFGDLVGSALGQNKGNRNSSAPLKSAAPAPSSSTRSTYSMRNAADSLPGMSDPFKSSVTWGSYGSMSNTASVNPSWSKSSNLGGHSMKGVPGDGMGKNMDPFGSLVNFGSKQPGDNLNTGRINSKSNVSDDAFGVFQDASKPSMTAFPSTVFSSSDNDFTSSNFSSLDSDKYQLPTNNAVSQNQPAVQTFDDPLGIFFSSTSASGGSTAQIASKTANQQFSGVDDWRLDAEFGGVGGMEDDSSTIELEGLPPPPSGITGSAAKRKGIDNKNQGQYADAIKWFSWAVILLEKARDKDNISEALSCRASCYKEVGEYKKAVADCSKVLEFNHENISVLVQRALLYESMEKYRLGAEDLRMVLKIDPGNRIARGTIHRMNQMAD